MGGNGGRDVPKRLTSVYGLIVGNIWPFGQVITRTEAESKSTTLLISSQSISLQVRVNPLLASSFGNSKRSLLVLWLTSSELPNLSD